MQLRSQKKAKCDSCVTTPIGQIMLVNIGIYNRRVGYVTELYVDDKYNIPPVCNTEGSNIVRSEVEWR